jgi:hypothetical protein
MFAFLGGAEAVDSITHPVRNEPWVREGTDMFTSVLVPVRNFEFNPLVFAQEEWQNVPWPQALQVTPIESSRSLWNHERSGMCILGVGFASGDCGN